MTRLPILIKILSLCIISILVGCETENELINHQQADSHEITIKRFQFNDLILNPTFKEGIEQLNSVKLKNKITDKSSERNLYNFTLDSIRIKEVIRQKHTSYTLLIKRPFKTPHYFENLVIEKREHKITKAFIIKYTLKAKADVFEKHDSFSFESSNEVIPLDINNLDFESKTLSNCSTVAQVWCDWDYPHVAGPACYEANDGRIYIKYVEDESCTETGFTNGTNAGSGSDADSGSTTGTGSGMLAGSGVIKDTDDIILTSPIAPDGNTYELPNFSTANEINNLLGNPLSESQMLWLFDNARKAEKIKLFLETHDSAEAKSFAEEVIIAHTLYSFDVNNFNFYNQIFQFYENNRELDEKALEEAILTLYTNYVDPPWERNGGFYNNIPSLEYTASRSFTYRGVPITQFKLTNGDVISQGDYGPFESDFKIFYNIQGTTEWFEMPDPTNYQNLSLDFIFNSFWTDVATPFARYFTPLEDAIILIDGKNFEGVAESRATAGLFVLVDLVPGGKVLKITRKAGHTLSAASPVIKIAIDATTKAQLNLKNQWKNVIAHATDARKGNFGEICTDIDFVEKGYDVMHVNRHTTIDPIGDNTGIDHIFKNPVTGEYVIVESKFHGTGGLSTLADGTRQMSDEWISNGTRSSSDRLWRAVGGDLNLYNQIKPSLGVNNYERVIGYIQANGTINYKYVSGSGVEINTVFNN